MKQGPKSCCGFSLPAVGLSLAAASLAGCLYSPAGAHQARSVILLGLAETAVLSFVAWLFGLWAGQAGLFSGRGFLPKLAGWLFFLWFGAEFFRTMAAAQTVCREEFGTNALIAVLPVLLAVTWQMDAGALDRSARALWWLLAAGAAICLAGLWDQMHWQRLFQGAEGGLLAGGWPPLPLYPEYFALPLLCQEKDVSKGALLPFGCYAIGGGYAFVLALVLGRPDSPAYAGLELLRAWAMGYFSRLDAFLLLVWLAAALWRLCLLAFVLRRLARLNGWKTAPAGHQTKGAQT